MIYAFGTYKCDDLLCHIGNHQKYQMLSFKVTEIQGGHSHSRCPITNNGISNKMHPLASGFDCDELLAAIPAQQGLCSLKVT